MRRVGVLTVGRSDYGIYRPVLKRMAASESLQPILVVSGAHLSPEFGYTVREIEDDGFEIGERVQMLLASDSPEGVSKSMGLGLIGLSQAYSHLKPDLLLVLGDRFEMMAGALAALPFHIPVAHIHGGELSQGAIDDSLRHAITKLSHVHFASTEAYAKRIVQLGEEEWRVHVSGAPGLDAMRELTPLTREMFHERFGIELPGRFLLVTYHPTTLQSSAPGDEFEPVIEALAAADLPVLFTMPNEDPGNRRIRDSIRGEAAKREGWFAVEALGSQGYLTAMKFAAAVVGNSSSGIIEAASFEIPVVNIGARQMGRLHASNVMDVPGETGPILRAIQKAVSPEFKAGLKGMTNPYGNGHAAETIVKTLEAVDLDHRLLQKGFVDVAGPP